jgi:hypothetical protein
VVSDDFFGLISEKAGKKLIFSGEARNAPWEGLA